MSIQASELKAYRSKAVSDAPSNGGLMSIVEVVSGVSANMFANASAADRTAGAVQYRKMFFKVANVDDLALLNPRIWQDTNTVGGDRVVFMPTSQRSTQADITGVETLYGMGTLSSGAISGATTIDVEVEHGPTVIFRDGGLLRISNKDTPLSVGDEVWVRISGVPVVVGNIATITLATALPIGFLSGTKVSSVYEASNIQASAVGIAVSSATGGIDVGAGDRYLASDIGSVEQNWTITFFTATAFDIAGDTLGMVGSGNTLSTTAPVSNGFAKPYFTILPSLFTGTFSPGDTITFTTHPAATPVFLRRTIPAGTAAVGSNSVSMYIDGETQ